MESSRPRRWGGAGHDAHTRLVGRDMSINDLNTARVTKTEQLHIFWFCLINGKFLIFEVMN